MSIDLGPSYNKRKLESVEELIEKQRIALGRPKISLADLGPSENRIGPMKYKNQLDLNQALVLADLGQNELRRQVGENQSANNYFDSTEYYNRQSKVYKLLLEGIKRLLEAIGVTDDAEKKELSLLGALSKLNNNLNELPKNFAKTTVDLLEANPLIINDIPAGISEEDIVVAFKNVNIEEGPFENKQIDINQGRFPCMDELKVDEEILLELTPRNEKIRHKVSLMENNIPKKSWLLTQALLKALAENTIDVSDKAKKTYMEILEETCGEYIRDANRSIDKENLEGLGLISAEMFLRWYERSIKFSEWIAEKYDIPNTRDLELYIAEAKKALEADDDKDDDSDSDSHHSEFVTGPITRSRTKELEKLNQAIEQGQVTTRRPKSEPSSSQAPSEIEFKPSTDIKPKIEDDDAASGDGIKKPKENKRRKRKLIIISPNTDDRFKRLNVLLGSKEAGNNVGLDEFTAILDTLLKEKKIKKRDYSRFMKAWNKN